MINGRKVLALIPARGGSKGIKNKNIIDLCGRPLISYTIMAAKESKYIDAVVVTTDDDDIATVSKEYGAEIPFIRPVELAEDNSKTIDAVIHAINILQEMGRSYDILTLLQPTQPLRTADDIDNALEVFEQYGEEALVSVSVVHDHPILMRRINIENRLISLLPMNSTIRRQDMPIYYKINGCIYINKISELNYHTSFNDNHIPYIMERSHSVDIDEMSDLVEAEYYLNERLKAMNERE